MEKEYGDSLRKLKTEWPEDPALPLLDVHADKTLNSNKYLHPYTHSEGFPRWHSWWRICLPMQETQVQCLRWEIPWSGKWHPLQYSCLDNPMDRGAWQTIVHAAAKIQTRLSDWAIFIMAIFTTAKHGSNFSVYLQVNG